MHLMHLFSLPSAVPYRLAPCLCPLLIGAALSACQTPGAQSTKAQDPDVLVVAHRTCWREAAENSLEGLRACIRQGVDIAEMDVRATRDGVLVLMHDPTIDRTTDGTGQVSRMTYAELGRHRLKAGRGGKRAPITTYRIPTLEEALREADGRILVELDIKDSPRQVMDFLQRYERTGHVVLATDTGFDPRLDVRWRLALTEQDSSRLRLRLPNGATPYAISANWRHMRDANTAFARIYAQGGRIWSVTLTGKRDTPSTWDRYIRTGRSAIHTDRPDALLEHLRSRETAALEDQEP